MSCFLIR